MWFEGIAYAQAAGGSAGATSEQVLYTTIIPLGFLFAIFYFVLIRPQTKKAADHDKMLSALKRNDEVVTTGGLLGRIVELGDKLLALDVNPLICSPEGAVAVDALAVPVGALRRV